MLWSLEQNLNIFLTSVHECQWVWLSFIVEHARNLTKNNILDMYQMPDILFFFFFFFWGGGIGVV